MLHDPVTVSDYRLGYNDQTTKKRSWVHRCSVLLLTLVLCTQVLGGWEQFVAHAATRPQNPNPPLKAPAWLNSSTGHKQVDLGKYFPPMKVPPINDQHAWPISMKPAVATLTNSAQHIVTSDGQISVDVPAQALDSTQLASNNGHVQLVITQVKPGSGGLRSDHIFFGTYELQLFDAQGKALTGLHLQHPLTVHLHLNKQQQNLVWKDQKVYALWSPVQGTAMLPAVMAQAQTQTAVVPAPATSDAPTLLYAQGDSSGTDWSIQTNLSASTISHNTSGKSQTPQAIPAVQASSVTFGTQAPQATWGSPTDSQVDLNSGGLNYNYSLSLPPGPGGLLPLLSLNYSSGAVNENYNVQATSPWVGQGWSLDLGSISWAQENVTPNSTNNLESVWHINDPSGISGQLIPPDITFSTDGTLNPSLANLQNGSNYYIWHTAPESHAKIREIAFNGAPCWRVYLPDGIMQEFGCTNDSRESYQNSQGAWMAYSWRLDLMIDRFGNQVHITYQTDGISGAVRDSAIQDITYDDPTCHNTTLACGSWNPKVDIHFDAAHAVAAGHLLNGGCGNGTSTTRCDDPTDISGGLPAPKVMNAYVLNDIKINVQGNLLHEYVFSYNQAGPGQITDPATGQKESVAGYLLLTKIQELGTNGTQLNAPVITMQYQPIQEHYADLFTPAQVCNPNDGNTPHDGSTCYLWSQTQNLYYISTLDNGRNWHENITWKEAHANTWGVDSGAANDAFTCSTSQTATNICGRADDKNWSRIVVASRQDVTNNVTSTWSYKYYLRTGVGPNYPGYSSISCTGSCTQHPVYTWGDQNDNDYADYYNGDFQSFAQVQVTQPDNTSQVHNYGSTDGWGLANHLIHCYLSITCSIESYNAPIGPVLAGKEQQEQDYDSNGNLLKQINWNWATNCPPQGVKGSANAAGGQYDPGSGFLFSELDKDNPVMVCDPRVTQEDTYLTDGVTSNINDPRVLHTTSTPSYDTNNCGAQGYDYGNVSQQDVTANDVGGQHFISLTLFCPNDNISGGVYLTNLPAQTMMQDGGGTQYGCHVSFYGGSSNYLNPPTQPDVTRQEDHTGYSGPAGCSIPGSLLVTLHNYDASGNPVNATDPDNHLGCNSGSAQYTACATYDGFGVHLLSATNAKNQTVSYTYDSTSASTGYGEWLMGTTDANKQLTTYQYDALGRLTAVVRPGDTNSNPTTTYTYTNTCTPWVNQNTPTTPCIEVDTSTHVNSGDTTLTTTRSWYDGMGRLVETQTPGPNLFSKVPAIHSVLVTYTLYDNMGRATTKSLPYAVGATGGYIAPDLNQARTVTRYDALGRSLGSVTYSDATTIVLSSTTSYTVEQGVPGFTTDTTTPFEQITTQDAYNHQHLSFVDALGRDRYEQAYDGTGSSGNPYSLQRTIQYNHDTVGNVLSVITFDKNSNVQASSSATYDGMGRATGANDSDRGSCSNTPMPADCSSATDTAWKTSYDADGNVISQTDPRNQSTYTSYDVLNRPLCRGTSASAVNPCQSSAYAAFFYDSYDNGSNPGLSFPAGCTAPAAPYASDPIGTAVAETFSSSAGSGWRCVSVDARGQQDQSTLSVTADGQTTTQTVNMSYNNVGQLTDLVYPDGEHLTSTYDTNGNFRSAYLGTPTSSDPVTFLVGQVNYTNNGLLAGLNIGGSGAKNSVPTPAFSTSESYDGIQRPLSSSASRNGQTFWSQTRTYDNVGNILGLSTTLPTLTGGSVTDVQSFCYDGLSRLVWAGNTGTPAGGDHCGSTPTGSTVSTYQQAFSYDNLDRITNGPAGSYSYDANHVHAATTLSTLPGQYASYDAMGNMTCRNVDTTSAHTCDSSAPSGASMTYDAEGRLDSWTAPNGTTADDHYLYDPSGSRVLQRSSTTTNGQTQVTDTITFDGYTETTIINGSATTTKFYLAGGMRVAMWMNNTLYYLLGDSLGSVSLALKSDGSLQAVQLFAPYGSTRYTQGTMPTTYNFTGQRLDSQTGLLYYNARYYDPFSGRFISADTIENNASGMDSYAYVGDNPESWLDPSGHRIATCMDLCEGGPDMGGPGGPGDDSPPPRGGYNTGDTTDTNNGNDNYPSYTTDQSSDTPEGEANKPFRPGPEDPYYAAEELEDQRILEEKKYVQQERLNQLRQEEQNNNGDSTDDNGNPNGNNECGGGLSFTSTTKVTTAQGKQSIGSLHPGDKVWAYNPQSKKMELQPILHVWVNHDTDLVDLTLTFTDSKDAKDKHGTKDTHGKSIQTHPEIVHTNARHPFLTKEKGFLPVGKLKIGMHILRADGSVGVVSQLHSVSGGKTMYNLEVAHDHTFTVGDEQWIVHNSSCIDSNGKTIPPDQQLVNDALKAKGIRPNGTSKYSAGAVANVNGQIYSANNGPQPPPEDIVGSTDYSNCADRCLAINIAKAVGPNGLQDVEVDVVVSQATGRAPCEVCQTTFQQLARYTGGTFRIWWTVDRFGYFYGFYLVRP